MAKVKDELCSTCGKKGIRTRNRISMGHGKGKRNTIKKCVHCNTPTK